MTEKHSNFSKSIIKLKKCQKLTFDLIFEYQVVIIGVSLDCREQINDSNHFSYVMNMYRLSLQPLPKRHSFLNNVTLYDHIIVINILSMLSVHSDVCAVISTMKNNSSLTSTSVWDQKLQDSVQWVCFERKKINDNAVFWNK